MKRSKEGRRKRRRKEGRSKRSAESEGTRGIIRPSTPQAHPLPPLSSYPLHPLPRATPLDHSRHSSYLPPSSALHLSLFSLLSLSLSFLRPCFSHFVTLYFTPCLDFMRTAKNGVTCFTSSKCARSGKIIVNLSFKLIATFKVFYKFSKNVL